MSTSRRRSPVAWRTPTGLITAITAASALAAMASGASPTGNTVGDLFWNGLVGGVLARATVDARRWTWFPMAGAAATLGSTPLAIACGVGSLIAVFAAGFFTARRRWIGALAGGLAAQALLRGYTYGFTGLPTIVAVAACTPLLISAYRNASARTKRVARAGVVVGGVLIGLLTIFTAVSAVRARDRVSRAIEFSNDALDAAEAGDQTVAAGLIGASAEELDAIATDFNRPWLYPARFVPILGPHAAVLQEVADAGASAADDAAEVLAVLDPDAIVAGAGRIDVAAVDELVGPMARLRATLEEAVDDVSGIDTTWLANPAEERVVELVDELETTFADVEVADELVSVAGGLLGGDEPRHYLVLFMTAAESRGAGGFAGNWAELLLDDGAIELVEVGRGSDITDALPVGGIRVPPTLDRLYDGFELETTFQNVPVSPDFPTVANLARLQYEAAIGRTIDGVIGIDHAGMAGVVRLTGPVEVDGERLNANQVEAFVLRNQYIAYADDRDGRLDALDDLTRNAFEQLVETELPSPTRIVDIFEPLVAGHHLRVVSFDGTENVALQSADLSDAFPVAAGQDLVSVVTQNLGENKIDIFFQRDIAYEVTVDPDTGVVDGTLTVTLTNDAPSEGLPQAIIGNNDQGLPFGTNRVRVQVYSPLDVVGARLDGAGVQLAFDAELGWSRYVRDLWLDPGQTEVLELDLRGAVDVGNGYVVQIEHQPVANADSVRVNVQRSDGEKLASVTGLDPAGRAMVTLDTDLVVGAFFED